PACVFAHQMHWGHRSARRRGMEAVPQPWARPVAEAAPPALRCSAFSPTAQAPADRRGQGPCAESEPDRPLAQPQHSWTEVRRAATEPIAAALPAQRPAPCRDPAPAVPDAETEARGSTTPAAPG